MVNTTSIENVQNDHLDSANGNECAVHQNETKFPTVLEVFFEPILSFWVESVIKSVFFFILQKELSKKGDVEGEFEWNEFQQGIILSSFFWGYLLFQIPGGRVAELWGPKAVFGISVLLNGVLSLSLPIVARIHWTLLLVVRALQGLGQGVIFPCLTACVPRWVPVEERARFISFAIQGLYQQI